MGLKDFFRYFSASEKDSVEKPQQYTVWGKIDGYKKLISYRGGSRSMPELLGTNIQRCPTLLMLASKHGSLFSGGRGNLAHSPRNHCSNTRQPSSQGDVQKSQVTECKRRSTMINHQLLSVLSYFIMIHLRRANVRPTNQCFLSKPQHHG